MTNVGQVSFRMVLDTSNLRAEVSKVNALLARQTVRLRVSLDQAGVKGELAKISQTLKDSQRGVRIPVTLDTRGIKGQLAQVSKEIRDLGGLKVRVQPEVRGGIGGGGVQSAASIARQQQKEVAALNRELVKAEAAAQRAADKTARIQLKAQEQQAKALAREMEKAEKALQRSAEQAARIDLKRQEREAAALARETEKAAVAAQRLQAQQSRDQQVLPGARFSGRETAQIENSLKRVSAETKRAEEFAALLRQKYGLADAEARRLAGTLGGARQQQNLFNQVLGGVFAGEAAYRALEIALGTVRDAVAGIINQFQEASNAYKTFEENILNFEAKAGGVSAEIVDELKQEVLDVAAITSQSPQSLSEAAANLVSAGVNPEDVAGRLNSLAKASDILKEEPELLAKITQSALQAYGDYGVGVEEISDLIVQAVNTTAIGTRRGAAEFEQLFSKSASIAASQGVDPDELVALDALLAGGGALPEARATAIETLLTRIANRRDRLAGEEVDLGIKDDGVSLDLLETLENIRERVLEIPDTTGRLSFLGSIFNESAGNDIQKLLEILETGYADVSQKLNEAPGAIERAYAILEKGTNFQAELVTGFVESARTQFGEALNPAEFGIVKLQQAVLELVKVDISPLSEGAERLGAALSGNPELAEALARTLSGLAQAAIDQIGKIFDALTALSSNPDFIAGLEKIGKNIEFLINLLGRFAQGLIGGIELLGAAQVDGGAFESAKDGLLSVLGPIDAARNGFILVVDAVQAIGNAIKSAGEAVAGFAERFPGLIKLILDSVPGLNRVAGAVGGIVERIPPRFRGQDQPEQAGQAGEDRPPPQPEPQDNRDRVTQGPQEPRRTVNLVDSGGGIRGQDARTRANKELTTRLNEIEEQGTQERLQLTEQGADQEAFAEQERKTLNQRIAARQAFINRLKELQQNPGNTEQEQIELASALANAEKELANDRLTAAQNFQRDRQTILDNIVRDNTRANAELERDNAQEGAALAAQNLNPRDRQAAEARLEQDAIKDRIANREQLLAQLREQEAKGGLSADQARELGNQILAVETEIFGARAELSQSLEAERLRLAEQGYADQLLALNQFKEQEALRAGQQTTGIQNQQQLLEADTGLITAQNQLEQARLATALATAQAEAGVAVSKRDALAAQREINDIQLATFNEQVEATAQELAAKRQSFELSAKLTRIEAQRAIQSAEIAALEAQIEVQRARTAGATQQEIAGLQAVATLLQEQVGVARDSAAVTDQVLGTKREALTVEEQIAEEQLKQNGILAEGNRLAEARKGIISALAAESSATPEEGITTLDGIQERFREAQRAGLFRGENIRGDVRDVQSALRSGNDRRLFELAQSDNPLIGQLIDAAGRSDITGLVAADRELALAKSVEDGNARIVDRLDKIIEQGGLGARIEQLVVQTPDPVADTSRIVNDVANMQAAEVNA